MRLVWASVRSVPLRRRLDRGGADEFSVACGVSTANGSAGWKGLACSTDTGRHREVSSLFLWHQQPEHPRRAGRPPGQTDCRVQRPLHPHRDVALPRRAFACLPVHQRNNLQPDVRIGLEVVGSAGAHRAAQHQGGHWVPAVQETDALLVWGGMSLVSVPLDAAIRTGRPLAVAAARDGLCRAERREHGGDSRLRRSDLRRAVNRSPAATKRWDWSTSRCFRTWIARMACRLTPWPSRSMGRRAIRAGIRDRRSDRHQSDRRHRRSRLRGALEAVTPSSENKLIAVKAHTGFEPVPPP